jgi:hypothetical protein
MRPRIALAGFLAILALECVGCNGNPDAPSAPSVSSVPEAGGAPLGSTTAGVVRPTRGKALEARPDRER